MEGEKEQRGVCWDQRQAQWVEQDRASLKMGRCRVQRAEEAGAGPLPCCDSSGHPIMDVDEQDLFWKLRTWLGKQKGYYERTC